jgi:hypothetical protein
MSLIIEVAVFTPDIVVQKCCIFEAVNSRPRIFRFIDALMTIYPYFEPLEIVIQQCFNIMGDACFEDSYLPYVNNLMYRE